MELESEHHIGRVEQHTTHRRNQRKKFILLLTTFLVLTACIVLVIGKGNLITLFHCAVITDCSGSTKSQMPIAPQAHEQCKTVCTSPACLEAASELSSFLDPSVDPCVDFSLFSCGRRAEGTFVPNSYLPLSHPSLLTARMMTRLLSTIENVNGENKNSLSFKRKKLFDSCLKYARSEETGVSAIRGWLDRAGIPGWPRMTGGDRPLSHSAFDALLGAFLSLDENPFLDLTVSVSGRPEILRKNTEKFGQTFVPYMPNETVFVQLTQKHYCGAADLEDYRNLSVSLLLLFGATAEESNQVVDDMVEVHNKLQNATRNISYEDEELNCSTPENALNNRWCVLFFQQLEYSNAELNVSNAKIELSSKAWFEFSDRFLNEYNQRKVINYMSLKFILKIVESIRLLKKSFLPGPLFPKKYNCRTPNPLENPEDLCSFWIISNFHYILAPYYIEQHDLVGLTEKVRDLFDRMLEMGESLVENAATFTEEEKEALRVTFKETILFEGDVVDYFSTVFDAEKTFSQLEITDSFISNAISLKKLRVDERTRNPENLLITMMMKDDNPFSVQAKNGDILNVFLGFFQEPTVALNRPRYIDFGSLGTIIAHEISHNFDFKLPEFRPEVYTDSYHRCLAEQYSRYQIPETDRKLNGNLTLHENFADNLGVFLSYKAYQKYVQEFGEEASLPGITFTNDQLFFIYFSQTHCEYADRDTYMSYVNGRHSPGRQRIQGTLKNSKEFSEAFGCPVGSPMNPEKKCELYFQ